MQGKFWVPERLKKITLQKIGEGWKEQRNRWFKKRHNGGATPLHELLADVPDGVPQDQWENFVAWKTGDLGQRRTRIGQQARAQQHVFHTAGCRPFSVGLHEMVNI